MGELSPYHSHNESILNELTVGDLIEFKRGIYSHWAVYLGDLNDRFLNTSIRKRWIVCPTAQCREAFQRGGNGQIIHLAGDENDGIDAYVQPEHMFTICGARFSKANVCIDDFWKVAAGSKAHKNNTKDEKWRPLSPAEIVRNACAKIGKVNYNLLYSNCEHFAKWCRYGIERSDQVEQVMTGAAVGLATILATGVVYAFSKYFKKSKEEEEKQKEKMILS